jgi:hypothetical protein
VATVYAKSCGGTNLPQDSVFAVLCYLTTLFCCT